MKFSNTKLIAGLLVFFMISCGEAPVEEPVAEVYRPVTYQVVGNGVLNGVRSFSGVAKANDEIELSFMSSGMITKINVQKGKKVNKGALVARLDNIEADLGYEKSVSAAKSAESAKNTAETELARVKIMYEKSSASLSEYESAKNAFQNALSGFNSAKRQQEIQRTQVGYGFIYAPATGIIAETEGSVNERVSAGHVFAKLNAGDKLKIDLGLPENVINRVTMGMTVEISFAAIKGKTFEGSVVEISPIMDSEASVFPVSVSIIGETEKIKPGMAANVTMTFAQQNITDSEALVVPIKSVGENGNGNFVFIIEPIDDEFGIVKQQTVEVGKLRGDGFEIVSGLESGQFVAIAGIQSLLDGQKVRL